MTVVCFGDSNTYGYDPRSFLGERYPAKYRWVDVLRNRAAWPVINEGQNGRTVPNKWNFLPDEFDLLIVMLGTNDLLQGKTSDLIAERMERFLRSLNKESAKVLLVAPPNLQKGEWVTNDSVVVESVRLSKYYNDLACKYGLYFVDAQQWGIELAYDGVHFTERGHIAFAEKIYDYINSQIFFNDEV